LLMTLFDDDVVDIAETIQLALSSSIEAVAT
jgi:hypothetical protein